MEICCCFGSGKTRSVQSLRIAKKQTNMHHIVPKGMISAQPARDILASVNINCETDSMNLVKVSTQMHWFMHTAAYVDMVNWIIDLHMIKEQKQIKQKLM